MGGQHHGPAVLPPYPVYRKLSGPQDQNKRVLRGWNLLPMWVSNPRTANPVAYRYTDCPARILCAIGMSTMYV
jgi:cell division septal protein FtsQ